MKDPLAAAVIMAKEMVSGFSLPARPIRKTKSKDRPHRKKARRNKRVKKRK